MKKGWQTKRLGEVTTKIGSGATPRGGDESYKAEGISLIRSLNVYDDGFREAKLARIDDDQADDLSNVVVEPHDVLLNITGASVARCCRAPADFLPARVNQHVSIIRPIQEKLDSDFLHYLLISRIYKDRLLHTGEEGGSTRQAITKAQLQEFVIDFPTPLAEQRRIVGLLDEAFEGLATAKANAEKNLQSARALFESHLQFVFSQRGPGWVEKRLGDLSRINYGYTESASSEKVGPHFLRITDIQNNGVDWDTVPYCPIDASDFPKYRLADGDIVFARTGATTGKSYLVSNPPESVFASYLIRVQLSDTGVLPQFVNLFFQTPSYWDIIRAGVSGSAQGGFNATKLGELVIPFPKSSKEQSSIVAKLDKLTAETQRLAGLYERKLAALEALKKSLLHQAFSGEL